MLLGIDLGTTAVKALLLTPDGAVAGAAEAPVPTLPGGPGEHEQEPSAWWDAVLGALRSLVAGGASLGSVTAVGLSGHTHGLVLVDAQGMPVRPCQTWADRRAVAEARSLSESVGARVRARCGNPVIEAFTLPKLLWVARHEPASLAAASRLVLPKDWLRWKLTGEWATDPGDAGSTLLYDVIDRCWDAELARAAGLHGARLPAADACATGGGLLPDVRPSAAVGGTITAAAARETGLPTGAPVAVGSSDVACAALGAGADEPAIAYVNIGTAAQLMTPIAAPSAGPAYTFVGAGRAPLLAMTSVFSAGHALDWLTELLDPSGPPHGPAGVDRHAALEASVARVPRGARGLLFLPHLLGASTPHLDARARGAFLGLTPAHGRDELRRAVIEGVAMAVRGALDALPDEDGAAGARRVRLGGGPSRSAAWTRILADALGVPVEVLATGSSPMGAALLGGLAAGTFADPAEAIAAGVRVRERIEPDPEAVSFYDDRRALAGRAFAAIGSISHELGEAA